MKLAVLWGLFLASPALADRYALFLQDEPVSARFHSRADFASNEAILYRQSIQTAQISVQKELKKRGIHVTGAVNTLLNAIFVVGDAANLADIPGVIGVAPVRHHDLFLNRATTLMNGPQAWNLTPGGKTNAGAGIRIGILDTGVDQTHPALTDTSLSLPGGFPKCNAASDCTAFTNTKVIVARSYVSMLPAADDSSARDHSGHGTAVAAIAAGNTAAGTVSINGMAPKAYIGSYRIFGSPTINDGTFEDVEVKALEDAIADGMDIISFSGGGPALSGPLDTCSAVPCDVAAAAFEAAARAGATIVVAAGNDGSNGYVYPLYNSLSSPGDAPSVITVGATTNSHLFTAQVKYRTTSLPALMSDSYASGGALTATLADLTRLGNDGFGCSPLPAQSLNGAIALIQRGPAGANSCSFNTKMTNAVNAGAWGVIFYMADYTTTVQPTGLIPFTQTAAMIALNDGLSLKAYIDANLGAQVTIDPAAVETSGAVANRLASFSSFGAGNAIKPDILATGAQLYMPAQNYDFLGELFSSNRFIFTAGATSFATPFVAGAAALVKQNHPGYTAAQIKSALVNTATQDVTVDDLGSPVNILQTGGGKLAADLAIQSNVTVSPATVSFGFVTPGSHPTAQLSVTGSGSLTYASSNAAVSVASNQNSVTLTLSSPMTSPGIYSGAITIKGGAIPVSVPWMYVVPTGVATNIQILTGDGDEGTVNLPIPDGKVAYKVTDNYGAPVVNTQVSWSSDAGVTLSQTSSTTDANGIASAVVTMGPAPGAYYVHACVAATCPSSFNLNGGFGYDFVEFSRKAPSIAAAAVVNAASYTQPIAPGSYITIFGSNLYDASEMPTGTALDLATGPRLPLVLDSTTVSFVVPSAGISVPCRMLFVSAGQVGCEVPWELAGQSSAQVKVSIGHSYGNTVTVPLSSYSPAMFTYGSIAGATDTAGHIISSNNAAVRGQIVTLYVNGLGPVTNQPASGEPASSTVRSLTTQAVSVTIGGQPGVVQFSGLAPTEIGVYQVNVTVPSNIGTGLQNVVISIGGVSSPAIPIPVQ